ncbi:tetratricopeptide repeat protein [candidate division WOR-3 bacterium]|nr:tetratricopeptide repeat protein [candidate division WOR-3 bacterium]
MKIPYILPSLVIMCVLMAVPPDQVHADTYTIEAISARVINALDRDTITINRGSNHNIIADSLCVIHPNRGQEQADIEWDIVLSQGRITQVFPESAHVVLQNPVDAVMVNDYVDVYAKIPSWIMEHDIGVLAMYDVVFVDYDWGEPLFSLEDLIAINSEDHIDTVRTLLIEELHGNSDVAAEAGGENRITGGVFDGMTWGQAFETVDGSAIDLFLEYVRYYPGRYINYDWTFIETFATWMINRTPTGEYEKKLIKASPLTQAGDRMLEQGQFQEALEYYKKALDQLPDYEYAQERARDVEKLLQYKSVVALDPDDVFAHYELGVQYYTLDYYEDAMVHLGKARDLGYDRASVDKYIAYTYVAQGKYEDAQRMFETLLVQDPKDEHVAKWLRYTIARGSQEVEEGSVEAHILLGNAKYEWGNYDGAMSEYQKAIALNPESRAAQDRVEETVKRRKAAQEQEWAADDWSEGDFESAQHRWAVALGWCEEIDDTSAVIGILDAMGDAMYDSYFYDDAIDVYQRIVTIDPGQYDAYVSLSNCYKAKQIYDQAHDWVDKAIATDPGQAWAYNIKGLIFFNTGDLQRAITYFEKAVGLDSAYKWPHNNLGLTYVKLQDNDKAQVHLQQAVEIDKDYWDARFDIGNLQFVIEAEEKLRADPDDLAARSLLGRALYYLEDYDRSVKELLSVVEKQKNDALALAFLGYSCNESGQYDQAYQYLSRSFKISPVANVKAWIAYNEGKRRVMKDPHDPEAYLKFGESDMYWNDFADALSDYEFARKLGADTTLVARAVIRARAGIEADNAHQTAGSYLDRAAYDKAVEYAHRAVELYQSIDAQEGEMWALVRLARGYAGLFQHDEALESYERAGAVAQALGDKIKYAYYLASIGDYYWTIGDYEKALECKREARTLFHDHCELTNEAWTLSGIGSILGTLGDVEGMKSSYEDALAIYRVTRNSAGESHILNELGWASEHDGDYAQALEYQFMALDVAKKYNDKWQIMNAYRGIAGIYQDLGDTTTAIDYNNHYLTAALAIGSKSDRAIALNDIGLVYLEVLKDYDSAMSYFKEALDLSTTIGYGLMEAVATANIGVTLSRQGYYTKALSYQEQSLGMVRELKASYQEMQGLYELGETYQGLKDFNKARECHLAAIEIAERTGVKKELWQYQLAAGVAYESSEDLDSALEYYRNAAQTLTEIKNKIKSEAMRKGFSELDCQTEVYKRLIDLLIRMNLPDEALKYIEESKSKIVRDAFGDVKPATGDEELQQTLDAVDKIERKKEAIEEQLSEERMKPANKQDARKIEALSEILASTEGEFNQWMMTLKFQNRRMYDALTINPASLGDIQQDIPEQTLLLEYFVSSDQLYIFCIGKNSFFATAVAVTEKDLERLVDYYLTLVKNPVFGAAQELEDVARDLYRYLIEPVEKQVTAHDNIVIIPFSVLYYLPFHALVRENAGNIQYLLEWKRISYTTSATFYDLLAQKPGKRGKLIALANPDGSLPGASEEVEKLKDEIFKKDAIIWTLSEATKGKFLEYAKEYDIIHLATHGTIMSNPLESYLLFAGDTKKEQRLTLLEVAGYTELRDRTDLVFLSACQTAMEKGKASGSELISLSEAFAMAGPPTLVATLWKVADVSTSMLVLEFYRSLKEEKADKLSALQNAQLSLLHSSEYAHPFYWAPFILLGNWR